MATSVAQTLTSCELADHHYMLAYDQPASKHRYDSRPLQCTGSPSANSAAVSVVQAGAPDAKSIKAAKANKKAQEFNQAMMGNDVIV